MDAILQSTTGTTFLIPYDRNRTVFNHSLVNSSAEPNYYNEYMARERESLFVNRPIIYVLGSVIVVSNLVVVVTSGLILKNGQRPKSCYMLLGNVSLADLLTGISMLLSLSVRKDDESSGMCIFQIGIILSPVLVSVLSVGLIAVDRYIYILHGLYYQRWISTTRVRIGILLTWVLGLCLGFMPVTGWAGDTLHGRNCWYINLAPPGLIFIISTVGMLPILLVCILYSIILFHALRTVSQLQGANKQPTSDSDGKEPQLRLNRGKSGSNINIRPEITTINLSFSSSNTSLSINTVSLSIESDLSTASRVSDEQNACDKIRNITDKMRPHKRDNSEPSKWRATKVVLLTTASFVCTWCPYFVTAILYILCDKNVNESRCTSIEVALASPLTILGLLNSVLNPIIYAWWHPGFKTAIKKIFSKKCREKTLKKSQK